MTVYLQDTDLTLHHGDALDTLRAMPAGSVDCVITSPPYWGLRSYDACGCVAQGKANPGCSRCDGTGKLEEVSANQLGLEATPDEYVANMVAVFHELRRVLADHGTCWVNLGDSYNTSAAGNVTPSGISQTRPKRAHATLSTYNTNAKTFPGLKPKDLVGIPWRVAFALQNDGWYLRADIIWAKPNPMPESVTDRPTKAHEYVFLLAKQPRYWFDAEAVREPHARLWDANNGGTMGRANHAEAEAGRAHQGEAHRGPYPLPNPAGRNIRSVWEIATQPYSEAHFATFPEELVRRCLLAGCPEWVCGTCGKARERIVEREVVKLANRRPTRKALMDGADMADVNSHNAMGYNNVTTLGWSDCGHNNYRLGVVLDPFGGSGTTALVARKHGRRSVLIELSEEYCRLAARRLQQLSLFAEASA